MSSSSMRQMIVLCLMIILCHERLLSGIAPVQAPQENNIVTSTKKIYIPKYSGAFNPSIIKFNDNYLLIFRYQPNRYSYPWNSHIGIIVLNELLEPISEPQLLDTRINYKNTSSQSEDARIFSYQGRLYLIYNDNMDFTFPTSQERRDMFIAELIFADHQFLLSDPIKLFHVEKYNSVHWQKNSTPFEWNGSLLLSYLVNPHEVISPDLSNGCCQKTYETYTQKSLHWPFGLLRGGTSAQIVDGEYLAFFHSGLFTSSTSSNNRDLWHYFMGAYTFSANPPFELTKFSPSAIHFPGFYTYSSYEKRVIYPGGFIVDGNNVYVAYGKDDCEIWIATIDLTELKKSILL